MRRKELSIYVVLALTAHATWGVSDTVESVWQHFLSREPLSARGESFVVRTDFDLNGDGQPEIFLSKHWTRSGWSWSVYDVDDVYSFKYLGKAVFHENNAWVPEPGVLRVLLPSSDHATLIDYHLVNRELVEGEGVAVEYLSTDSEEFKARPSETDKARQFWKDIRLVTARVEENGLGPWLDLESREPVKMRPVHDQSPEVVIEKPTTLSLLDHFSHRRPCPSPVGCKVWLLYKDVAGNGEAELLLNAPQPLDAPWLLYGTEGEGYRYFGEIELTPGFFERNEDGRLLALRLFPLALEIYRITLVGIEQQESVPVSVDRARVLAVRQRFLRDADEKAGEDYYWVAWGDLVASAENPNWTPVEGEIPVQLDIDFTRPVSLVESAK